MKKAFFFLAIFFLLLSIYLGWWWQNFLLPVNRKEEAVKVFVIRKGEGVDSIANNLKKEKLIKSPLGFKILVQVLGIAKNIQAGDFYLSTSMDVKSIAWELTHGTLDVWVTIPEGLRVEEIAKIINSKLRIPYAKFIEKANKYEGFLFPDTYLIPKKADTDRVIQIMTDNFNQKVGEYFNLEKAKREEIKFNNLTLNEIIILASIIEREARFNSDRPLVSSVLYNRLKVGMKLDVDSTVQYAKASQSCQEEPGKCDWWPKHLNKEDLMVSSAYNTYLFTNLPPGPICNPGLRSILAALKPATTDYWFYLSDKKGNLHFAFTIEEHNQNIKDYLSD